MSRTRWILSNLSVVNIVLAAVLIVFANNMFLPLLGKSAEFILPSAKKQAAPAPTTEKIAESKSPSPSDYFLIAEQNIFHPERKIPVEKKDAAAPPLPKPEFVLYGTIMLDDISVAYMEDKKAPQNTTTRGKKQIPLRLGETLSGFILREINTDKVVMVRGTEKLEAYLTDPSKSASREGAAGIPVAQAPPAGQQPQPVAPSVRQRRTPQQPAASAPAATVTQPVNAPAATVTQPVNAQPTAPAATVTQPANAQPTAPTQTGSSPASNRDAFFRLFNRR